MKLTKKRAALLWCSVVLAAVAGSALARPTHKSAQPASVLTGPATGVYTVHDERYPFLSETPAQRQADRAPRHGRRHLADARAPAQSHANSVLGGFTDNSLVAEARKYIGTNPTGRSHLWCGAFMDMILRETGHKGGGNLALGYEHYGHRVSGPEVGAIAVMDRRGGGHVGVVSGVDANGNPIIVSGNHNHTVAEAVYPRSRIAAYVMPGN
jgi:uncharacterized protein (TIGR02594 family)